MKEGTTFTISYNPSEVTDKRLLNELTNQIQIKVNQLEFIDWIETETGEEHRAIRLNDIISYFKKHCIINEISSFDKISSVLDYKGELRISWHEEPTDLEKQLIAKIWEVVGNENPDCVKHYLLTAVPL